MSAEKTSAQLCRENGWGKGTVLEQLNGLCDERVEITAVGETLTLARTVATRLEGHDWSPRQDEPELTRCFHRDTWKAVAAEPAAGGEEGASELEAALARAEAAEARFAKLEAWGNDEDSDGTDLAHPAWWRGYDYGLDQSIRGIASYLAGEREGFGSFEGVAGAEPTLANKVAALLMYCGIAPQEGGAA